MNLSHRTQELLNRVPAGPHADKIRSAISSALDTADAFTEHRAQLASSGKLTAVGLQDQLTADLQKHYASRLSNARAPVKLLRQRYDALVAEIKPKQLDKSDLVGELQRQERRAFIRSQEKVSDRIALSQKPEFLDAVLGAPIEMSGLPPDIYDLLMQTNLRSLHGDKIAEVEALEEQLEAADAALRLAEGEMSRAFGDARTFSKIAGSARHKPWLKKYVRDGQEVVCKMRWDPDAMNGHGSGSWVAATPNDIADGEFFPDWDSFYKANGIPDHGRDDFWRLAKAAA